MKDKIYYKSNLGIFQQHSEHLDDCDADYISYPNFEKAVAEILEREQAIQMQAGVSNVNGGHTYLNELQCEKIVRCVEQWNQITSITRACEELNELSVELLKLNRGEQGVEYFARKKKIKMEMADVHIALKHLEYKFGNYQEELNEKIESRLSC